MKSWTYPVITIVVLLALALVWTEPSCAQTVSPRIDQVLMVDCPFPPYMIEEGGQAVGGVTVNILQEIFRRLGIKLVIEVYPWKRALKMAESGRADGITFLMYDKKRGQRLVFSDVIMKSRETFYFQTGVMESFDWSDYLDLKPYTIGLVDGYVYGGNFLNVVNKFDLKVDYSQSSEENLTKLNGGRVDLVLEDERVAGALIGTRGWSKRIKAASKAVGVTEYRLAFSRRSPAQALLPEVNRVIDEMKKDGAMDRLVREWN
jgi:polar amino acid transport system substrate-binding protein